MSIEWVPLLNVPLHRRLELLSAAFQILTLLFGGFTCTFLFALLMYYGNVYVRTLGVLYLMFFYYDRETPDNGGRGTGCEWVRNWTVWKYFMQYFPIDLVKTADLPADRNYLLAVFPHGVLCFGAFGNSSSNYSKWRSLFPAIRSKCATLILHTYFPIYRELVLSWGMTSASADALTTLMTQSNDAADKSNTDGFTSNAVFLMVGGAQEAFYSTPSAYTVYLSKRKGFVRIAMQTGASLVPVISFGETSVFDTTQNQPGSLVRKLQELVKKYTSIAPILFNGRGFLQYSFGLIPKRHPITTVVGAPIDCVKNSNPSYEEVNAAHALFCEKLKELFNRHKAKYVRDHEKVQLEIL